MSDYSEHLISQAGGDGDPLDAIQRRVDAATEGPWRAGRGATSDGTQFVRTYEQKAAFLALSLNEGESDLWLVDNGAVIPAATGDGPKAKANAEFIAHARTDIPALLALVRAQQAAIKRVQSLHKPEKCWMPYEGAGFSYATEQEAIDALDDCDVNTIVLESIAENGMPYFEVCAECRRVENGPREGECVREMGYLTSLWPCPTFAALTATEATA
jgi:hypothetical protein